MRHSRDPVSRKEALALYRQADKGDWAAAAVLGDVMIELGHPELGAAIVSLSGQVMKGSTKESVASLRGQLVNVLWLFSPRPRRRPCLPNRKALTRLVLENEGDETAARRGVQRLWPELVKACRSGAWYRFSNVIERALYVANDVLHGYGVEALISSDSFQGEPTLLYVNQGESYADTLCYEIENARFLITSWGTFVERCERTGRYRFE